MDTSIGVDRTLSKRPSDRVALLPVMQVVARRLLFIGLSLATFIWGTKSAFDILSADRFMPLEWAIFFLFCLCFLQISLTFAQGLIGFLISFAADGGVCLAAPVAKAVTSLDRLGATVRPKSKTALVIPVYNEDPDRVAARLRAMLDSLPEQLSRDSINGDNFAAFVLSDTQDIARGEEEVRVFNQVREEFAARLAVTYRRRTPNKERKAGNIMDFCQRWGSEFDYMIVLDADSVMSGHCMLQLVAMMDSRPKAGIIQTCPRLVFANTFFARALQFAHRISGELLTAGAAFWQLGQGNYFGHNAIIRVEPFTSHCRLPVLSGRGPLSGEVLSHDFVEAAYLVRAGYEVWNFPTGEGSYEELPPNVIDYAKRERRWCQGNMQHMRIVIEAGLHPLSRFHLAQGILAYLSAPIWFLLIAFSLARFSQQAIVGPVYFSEQYQLFPDWPEWTTPQSLVLFFSTFALLLAPKFFGVVIVIGSSQLRRQFGGVLRLILGLVVDVIASSLLAPVMMVYNSIFVTSILSGQGISWSAQTRDARGISKREALQHMFPQIILAVVVLSVVLFVMPNRWAWYIPLLAGLFFSLPLTVFSSRFVLRPGALFTVPEESEVPAVLAQVSPH